VIILSEVIAIDTETTGLYPYLGDYPFMISVASKYGSMAVDAAYMKQFQYLFNTYKGTVFMHNAKFDLAMLEKLGITLPKARVIDTTVLARLDLNIRPSLKMEDLAKLVGYAKDSTVKEYVKEHKLSSWKEIPGLKKREKVFHYDKVPLEIMAPYAKQDAEITRKLGQYLGSRLNSASYLPVVRNEIELTRTLLDIEKRGMKIDTNFINTSIATCKDNIVKAKQQFEEAAGIPFVNSAKTLSQAFSSVSSKWTYTLKGNPSFDEKSIKKIDHPLTKTVLAIRENEKRVSSLEGLLFYKDENDFIHANIKQAGTATGRMSVTNPPMQCIEKNESSDPNDILIRRAFIPRSPDHYLFMMDFDQFEYRMMLNYAEETKLIKQVNEGVDVHAATAKVLGVDRKLAKTINFGLLYGIGIDALAEMLKVHPVDARDIKDKYFRLLPKVAAFIQRTIGGAAKERCLSNWMGRRYIFTDDDSYKAPNYLIQGGTADYIKRAMNKIHGYLKSSHDSSMLMQIHDELLFEIHYKDYHMVDRIHWLMENVPVKNHMKHVPYTCGIEYSETNWQDKKKWVHETRNEIQD
jgi:DNA polymerase-1